MALFTTMLNKEPNDKPPPLPPIVGNRNVEEDLLRFEQHMAAYDLLRQRWPAHLRPALKEDALCAFFEIPAADADDYDLVKAAILTRAGVIPISKLQQLLLLIPKKAGQAAAQTYGELKAVLNTVVGKMTLIDATETFALELTYRMTAPHIVAAVRALDKLTPAAAIKELDQYVVVRGLQHDKLWDRNRFRQTLHTYQKAQN